MLINTRLSEKLSLSTSISIATITCKSAVCVFIKSKYNLRKKCSSVVKHSQQKQIFQINISCMIRGESHRFVHA